MIYLSAASVVLWYADNSQVTLNTTSATLAKAGTPSVIQSISISRATIGPAGHEAPLTLGLTVLTASPAGIPLNTRVRIALAHHGAAIVDQGGATYAVEGYVEQDAVDYSGYPGLWAHSLTVVCAIAKAAARACGITRPVESADARMGALLAACTDISGVVAGGVIPASDTSGNPITSPIVAALTDANTNLLDALRRTAMAAGQIVSTNGRLLKLRPYPGDSIGDSTPPYGGPWWGRYALPQSLVTISPDQLTRQPVINSRESRVTRVEIGYTDTADAAQTSVIESPNITPTVLGLDSAIRGMTTALAWLQHIAQTMIGAPAQPTLAGAVRLVKDFPAGDTTSMPALLQRGAGFPFVAIVPTPAHLGRFWVVDGYDLVIDHRLAVDLTLKLVPASVYGLQPLRLNHSICQTTRLNVAYPAAPTGGGGPVIPMPGFESRTRLSNLVSVRLP